MESQDLNHDDAPLEAWLRDRADRAPLPDDGFSARVMSALPPAAAPATAPQRNLFILRALGVAITIAVIVAVPLVSADSTAALAALGEAVTRLGAETISRTGALVVAGTVGSLVVAYWRELRAVVGG